MIIITGFIIVAVALLLRAEYARNLPYIFFLKPLATLLIILLCLLQSSEISTYYKYSILLGLCCSLSGDVFLMLPSDQFIKGLIGFLCAHLFYIVALSSEYGFQAHFRYLLPIILLGGIIVGILRSHTGKMTIPVIIYTAVILVMLWQALERWGFAHNRSAMLAVIGASCFVFSDTILAYNRFVKRFKSARFLVLTTYYCAQWCIAMSV